MHHIFVSVKPRWDTLCSSRDLQSLGYSNFKRRCGGLVGSVLSPSVGVVA